MDQKSSLRHFIEAKVSQLKEAEKQFWELANNENHTKEQEISFAKELMVKHHFIQLFIQIEDAIDQEPDDKLELAVEYVLEQFNQDTANQLQEKLSKLKIEDVSQQARKYSVDKISEEQVKEYLIRMYNQENTDSEWSDTSSDVEGQELIRMNEEQIEELEKVIAEEENKHPKKQETEALEQQMQEKQLNELQSDEEEEKNNETKEEKKQEEVEEEVKEYEKFDEFTKQFKLHDKCICCLAQSPVQKELFASASCDDSFKIFKNQEGQLQIQKFCGQTVSLIDFSFDGKLLAIALITGEIYVYNLEKDFQNKLLNQPEGEPEPMFMKWHPKGNVLLGGYSDSTVWLWNGVTGDVMAVFGGHQGSVNCGKFSLDGKLVFTGGQDCTIRVWKPMTSEQLHKISGHGFHSDDVICFDQNQEQNILLSGGSDGNICLSNFENGKVISQTKVGGQSVMEVCFIQSKQATCAVGCQDGSVVIYNWSQMKLLSTLKVCEQGITKLICVGAKVVFSSLDGKIVEFDYRQIKDAKIRQAKCSIQDFIYLENEILIGCENGVVYLY